MNDHDERYGPLVTAPPVLNYDPAIYWVDVAWYIEQRRSIEVTDDPRAEQYAQHALDTATRRRASELRWDRCHQDDERTMEGPTLCVRRTIYECPFFREVVRYRGPPTIRTLRLSAPGQRIVELPLRRLMDYDCPSLGALHEETLYIVEIVAHA